jgi:hypothetical protein
VLDYLNEGGLITSYVRRDVVEPDESCFVKGNRAACPKDLTQTTILDVNLQIKVVMVIPEFIGISKS